jgi:cytochrome c551/c552
MRLRTVVAGLGAVVTLALTPVVWANQGSGGSASTASAIDGATLFAAKGCSSCHVGPDSSPMVNAGPSLAAAPEWAGDRIAGLSAAEYVEQSIRQPGAFISPVASAGGPAGPYMPNLNLTDDEIESLVDYVLHR